MHKNAFLICSISFAPVMTTLPDLNNKKTTLGFSTLRTAPGKSVGSYETYGP